jgi:hypothetical protein
LKVKEHQIYRCLSLACFTLSLFVPPGWYWVEAPRRIASSSLPSREHFWIDAGVMGEAFLIWFVLSVFALFFGFIAYKNKATQKTDQRKTELGIIAAPLALLLICILLLGIVALIPKS